MSKHAYLIMAHKDDYTFYSLIKMIDSANNNIFIHMDSKNKNFDKDYLEKIVKKSSCFFIERTNVTWGGYSQINAELLLLKCAVNAERHSYYHLLSGQDLPIKSQDYIERFFKVHDGIEFIGFDNNKFQYYDRVRYFYPLQEFVGRNNNIVTKGIKYVQKYLGVQRNRGICFQKGANWFSITDSLAKYVISKEKWIARTFHSTVCCDEIFLQTLVINSDFLQHLASQNFNDSQEMIMRLIDWRRGSPYIFRSDDIEQIRQSKMLFARKFSDAVDRDIIDKICSLYG